MILWNPLLVGFCNRAKLLFMSKSNRAQRGNARVNRPERSQVEMQFLSLDQWLDKGHRVRVVWQYVESLDLTELYARIQAVEGKTGRNAVDPAILFALWMTATLEGISSARRLAELTTRDIAYMWLCGGVSVNYHLLSDFRVDHGELLERLMVDSIAVLMHQKLVTLECVAQDGMRVRANAGSDTFRREESLADAHRRASEHLEDLKSRHEADPDGNDRRRRAAAERAARERKERIEQAQEELKALRESREKINRDNTNTRASTTDPEARRTKMGHGGFQPALNVQFVTDADTRLVVATNVVSPPSDMGQLDPMRERVKDAYGVNPRAYLVDGGFFNKDDITAAEVDGTGVYAPLPSEKKQLSAGKDPYARKPKDTDELARMRERMGTEQGKARYALRPSVAEFPNADCRNRGLHQFRVRGRVKAKAQTLWHVLAFNFLRLKNLGYLETVMAG